jgi:hypothetical protein
MSMTNVDSWAVDLTTIGPIYPMVGTEGLLVILGLVFWIGWHVWQFRFEQRTYDEEVKLLTEPGKLENAVRNGKL